MTIMGADQRCPNPPSPPHMGGAEIYVGGLLLMDIMTTIESNIFVKLLTSNITWAILGESHDPPYPLPS